MEITVSQAEGAVPITILHINGDITTNEVLESKALELIDEGVQYMILDFSNVEFMGSIGLRAIHQIYNQLRGEKTPEEEHAIQEGIKQGTYKSSHLKLLKPNENIMRVLSSTGYDMFIEIFKDQKEAVNSFQA